MKMSNTTYKHIDNAIKGLRDYCSDKQEFDKLRQSIPYKNSQFISFVWKIFYSSKNYYKQVSGIDIHEFIKHEGLSDSHVETALKQILIAYK